MQTKRLWASMREVLFGLSTGVWPSGRKGAWTRPEWVFLHGSAEPVGSYTGIVVGMHSLLGAMVERRGEAMVSVLFC